MGTQVEELSAKWVNRFWAKVSRGKGCWEWLGAHRPEGYGRVRRGSATPPCTHIVWEMVYGCPPTDDVLHTCDNPPCIRPSYLFVGSPSLNAYDSVWKGRHPNANKTHCLRGHEFNQQNTYVTNKGTRHCRTCRNLRGREYYESAK